MSHLSRPILALAICAVITACGSAPADVAAPTAPTSAIPATAAPASARLLDWPEFGLDPQRSDASSLSTEITSANVGHLRRVTVSLPGTVDSSPVYVHQAMVAGSLHNVVIATTSYGKTVAIDADSGRILWTFTPRGYPSWAGSSQITNSSPLVDPDRRFL
ncbi:MAG TPA: hypothetical protein VFR48_10855, partial [Solirubrobacteraceae bacterium]|nr:hypothetical protein [Solirubrobacteraceae bacterium]